MRINGLINIWEDPSSARRDPEIQAARQWFLAKGVPHFSGDYRGAAERWPALVLPLFVLISFEVGVAPWLDLSNLLYVIIAPPLVLLCVVVWRRLSPRRWRQSLRPSLQILAGIAYVGVCYVVGFAIGYVGAWLGVRGPYNAAANAVVVFLLLRTCDELLKTTEWRPRDCQWLLVAASLVLTLSVAEGTLIPSLSEVTDGRLPQALPALMVSFTMLWACKRAVRRSSERAGRTLSRGSLLVVPAVPIVLIAFGAEVVVLPATGSTAREEVVVAVVTLAVAFSWATFWWRRSRHEKKCEDLWRAGRNAVVLIWLFLFLLAYPVIVGKYFSIDLNTFSAQGPSAFVVTAIVNLLFLVLTWLIIALGLDRLAGWAVGSAFRNWQGIARAIVEGLPLLVAFVTFFSMSAELWQVAYKTGRLEFLSILALILILILLLMLFAATEEIGPEPTMAANCVLDRLKKAAQVNSELTPLVRAWEDRPASGDVEAKSPLPRAAHRNAVAVFVVYEALIFLPLAAIAFVILFLICRLAVSRDVAAEWIFGDGREVEKSNFVGMAQVDLPWPRVAAVLTLFALLYVAVEVISTDKRMDRFFGGAKSGMQDRLAMWMAYSHYLDVKTAGVAGGLEEGPNRLVSQGQGELAPSMVDLSEAARPVQISAGRHDGSTE